MKNPFSDLTKFEWSLWIASVCVIIVSFLVSGGNDILTVIASVIGVTALIFVAKGYVLGQILTVIFAVFYGIISFFFRYYGELITYMCMTAPIAAITTVSWIKHPYRESKEVQVRHITKRQLIKTFVYALCVTGVFYFILKALGTANLLFSTISVTTSFIASYLTFLRTPYYAIGYAANDLVLIILWTMATVKDLAYLPMILCFIMFFANDLYGFYNWRRIQKRQKSGS